MITSVYKRDSCPLRPDDSMFLAKDTGDGATVQISHGDQGNCEVRLERRYSRDGVPRGTMKSHRGRHRAIPARRSAFEDLVGQGRAAPLQSLRGEASSRRAETRGQAVVA